MGIQLRRLPSDSAFRYFFRQVDVAALCAAIRDWTIAQIPAGGGSTFIAQVTLCSRALGVAISQTCYVTGKNHVRAVLKTLLGKLDLECLLIQAVSLHIQRQFFNSTRSRGPNSS